MNRTTIGQSGDPTPLRILFIDPHSAFVTWGGELAEHGCDWQIVRMDDTQVALELLQEGRFDAVIVASLSSFERELGVLRRVADYDHRVARILLSPPLSVSKQAKALDVAHRNITQNSDLRDVISAVEQTVTVTRQLYRDKVVRSFAAFRQLPSPPGIYSELTRAVTADHNNARDIAAIVERDPALAARIMQLVNSSYFGLQRKISNLQEALTLLGVRTVRGLALAGHLRSHYGEQSQWQAFSFERLSERALSVARLAQDIAGSHEGAQVARDQAFLAGLLLDIGMLMLAAEQGDGYLKVLRYAARKELPLHVVERMAYGVTHAELGAYLLDMWNLPPQVVEAVLMHHTPDEAVSEGFTPLTAAHIADSLLPSITNEFALELNAELDEDYVQSTGCKGEFPGWKMQANAYRLRMRKSEAQSA